MLAILPYRHHLSHLQLPPVELAAQVAVKAELDYIKREEGGPWCGLWSWDETNGCETQWYSALVHQKCFVTMKCLLVDS